MLSVSEDADEGTDAEKPLFWRTGHGTDRNRVGRSRVVALADVGVDHAELVVAASGNWTQLAQTPNYPQRRRQDWVRPTQSQFAPIISVKHLGGTELARCTGRGRAGPRAGPSLAFGATSPEPRLLHGMAGSQCAGFDGA